jgi:anti-sigma B factor antagonist
MPAGCAFILGVHLGGRPSPHPGGEAIMNLEFSKAGTALVVRVVDSRIDAHGTPDLKAKVGERIDNGDHRIVFDLANVELVDSTGLGGILSLLKRLPRGGNVVFCGCRPAVIEVLKLTRLDRVFAVVGTVQEAVASLGS